MVWSFVASLFVSIAGSAIVPRIPDVPAQKVYNALLFVPLFIVLFFLSFFLLTRRTVNYLMKLSDGLDVIAGGNLRYRIPIAREDELGRVAENINRMAAELEQRIEKERRSEQSKMELITGISHDLRTPLTSIIGYMELLRNRAYRDDAEHERFIVNSHHKALQLKTLIDDLFEYTRLTSHDARLLKETIDLKELVLQTATEFQPFAEEYGLRIESAVPPQPLVLALDPGKMRRLIDNLFTNTLKFATKPGIVRLSLAEETDGDRRLAVIHLENEGVPITADQEQRLFERFYKADDSRSRGSSFGAGAGLGLSIARNIALLHGGDIRLVHDDGRFDFRIELPIIPVER